MAGVALLVLSLGCGQGGERLGSDGTPSPAPQTELSVSHDADGIGAGAAQSWTLACEPAGGTHPDAAGACAALTRATAPFAPVPSDTACTQIYGGPSTGRITGRYRGQPVSATFSRSNGCEISRWDAVAAVLHLPPAGPE